MTSRERPASALGVGSAEGPQESPCPRQPSPALARLTCPYLPSPAHTSPHLPSPALTCLHLFIPDLTALTHPHYCAGSGTLTDQAPGPSELLVAGWAMWWLWVLAAHQVPRLWAQPPLPAESERPPCPLSCPHVLLLLISQAKLKSDAFMGKP